MFISCLDFPVKIINMIIKNTSQWNAASVMFLVNWRVSRISPSDPSHPCEPAIVNHYSGCIPAAAIHGITQLSSSHLVTFSTDFSNVLYLLC